MGFRRFVRVLLRGTGDRHERPRHRGDELADEVRQTIGPLAGGSEGAGHMTGSSVYHHLEDRDRD